MKHIMQIIGFVIGSIFILYPGLTLDITGLLSIIFFCISFKIASLFDKK